MDFKNINLQNIELQNINVEKIAQAVELDAGQPLEGLRQSLQQARDGVFAQFYSPADISSITELKRRGRPIGTTKSPATLRIDSEALNRWRSSGKGWQTRAAQVLAQHAPA